MYAVISGPNFLAVDSISFTSVVGLHYDLDHVNYISTLIVSFLFKIARFLPLVFCVFFLSLTFLIIILILYFYSFLVKKHNICITSIYLTKY